MKKILSFNRLSLILISLFASLIPISAQTDSLANMPNMVLPTFTKAIVKMKTGTSYHAVMNYEMSDQEMIVLRKGQYFVLNDQKMVDTITIGNRIFVPIENSFYELLVQGPADLLVKHQGTLESEGSTLAYGAKSTAAGITHITTIYGKEGAIDLKVPENFKFKDASQTWIRKDATMIKFSNKKQLMKIFADSEKDLNLFIDSNNIDFKKTGDLVKLVSYYNKLQVK